MRDPLRRFAIPAFACCLLLAAACGGSHEDQVHETEPAATDEEPMAEEPAAEPAMTLARAELKNAAGETIGEATFSQEGDLVVVSIGFKGTDLEGPHGFHIHEGGECVAPDFASAGGHFNPTGVDHACPDTEPRHAGDFGNVEFVEGRVEAVMDSAAISLGDGPNSVIGKAVVLHGGADDCTSQPSGAAGDRHACGVIELLDM